MKVKPDKTFLKRAKKLLKKILALEKHMGSCMLNCLPTPLIQPCIPIRSQDN